MTIPRTTPGTLGRVRAWMTKIAPRNDRSPMRSIMGGSLLSFSGPHDGSGCRPPGLRRARLPPGLKTDRVVAVERASTW